MTPSTVALGIVDLEGAERSERPRTLARLLDIEDDGAIELIRRALGAAYSDGYDEARHDYGED